MRYDFTLLPEVRAYLRTLPKAQRQAIGYRMHQLCDDLAGDVKKLAGTRDLHRLRVGNFRVVFHLVDRAIFVTAVRDRKNAYE